MTEPVGVPQPTRIDPDDPDYLSGLTRYPDLATCAPDDHEQYIGDLVREDPALITEAAAAAAEADSDPDD